MTQGVVKEFDVGKGSGTVESDDGEMLPVHRSALVEDQGNQLFPGDIVEFSVGRNKFGRRAAVNVKRIGWEEDGGGDEPREWNF